MVTREIILLLVVLSIIVSGCLSSEEDQEQEQDSSGGSGGNQRSEETWTPEEIETAEELGTPTETETAEETNTLIETETAEEMETPEETVSSRVQEESEEKQTEFGIEEEKGVGALQPTKTAPASHLVRLKNYFLIPSRLEVNAGDIVVWRNFQESSVFTLTSKEGLFEDQKLAYGNTLEYTFNEPGSYSFSVKGYPEMKMTITVK